MNHYIVAVGNAQPMNYEVYSIQAKNRDQAIFQAALKCKKDDWRLLSIERKNLEEPNWYKKLKDQPSIYFNI